MERIFIEEEFGKKCTFYSNVVTVHELPGWVEGRYLKLTSSWIICGSMFDVIFVGLDPSSDRIRAARTPHSVPGITRCIISCKEVSAAAAAPFPSTFTNLIILAQGSSSKQAATPPQTFLHLGAELRSWQEKEWFLFACRGISELFSSNKNVSNWS